MVAHVTLRNVLLIIACKNYVNMLPLSVIAGRFACVRMEGTLADAYVYIYI